MIKPRVWTVVVLILPCLSFSAGGKVQRSEREGLIGQGIGSQSSPTALNARIRMDLDYGRMPLYFVQNGGQVDPRVSYYVQGSDKTLYFTPKGITFALLEAKGKNAESQEKGDLYRLGPGGTSEGRMTPDDPGYERWVVKLEFVGADPRVRPVGEGETGAVVSYFKGEKEDWHTGLRTFSRIVYRNLWPGVDLAYFGTVGRLKYEFIVQPGADPSIIHLAYRGADSIGIDEAGRLQVRTPSGGFSDDAPAAYQDIRGERVAVSLAYKLEDSGGAKRLQNYPEASLGARSSGRKQDLPERGYGFRVGSYNTSLPLVLDPAILVYCGYISGSNIFNDAWGIAVDRSGNAYVTGDTTSSEATFPVAVGPDLTYNGGRDAFVAKVNATGTALIYCGYIGGSQSDYGNGIAVDGVGNAYVTGVTSSTEATFPVLSGPDLTYNGDIVDAFVAKVNAAGTALVYCGYIGGSSYDAGRGIAVDAWGSAYVTGETSSTGATFPVSIGPDLTYNGGNVDAFVAKVDPMGTALAYCGYIGGSQSDVSNGIAIDGAGNAYVTGETGSTEATFPVTVGPDLTYNGGGDAFVVKVNAAGTALVYCGFIGGSANDSGRGIAVDAAGCAYVTGDSTSSEVTFPVTRGPDLTYQDNQDAFVAKLNPEGTALIYCGYIGGYLLDSGRGIALDVLGNSYVTGFANSREAGFPVVVGPDLTHNGLSDAFVAKVNATGTGLRYCGYIGGAHDDGGWGIAVDGSGNAYVCGGTDSSEATFPVIVGPDLTHNGLNDGFVAKVYYYDEPSHEHAVGDFDGDSADEVAMDFGLLGAWIYDKGSWFQITTVDPENIVSADLDGDSAKEIVLDLGAWGLWMWDFGVWTPLDPNNPEYLIAADTDGNGKDELIIDRGAQGLWWRDESGGMSLLSRVDAQDMISADGDGDGSQEVIADFGPTGMWAWDSGSWSELSGADALTMVRADVDGNGTDEIAAGFGIMGMWLRGGGDWGQLSGFSPGNLVSGKIASGWGEEIVGNFGVLGVWSWQSGAWGQLSGENAENMIAADTDGDGVKELAADFALLGLWLRDNGTWVELTGNNPEGILAADTDGDGAQELVVDFGSLGVWLWNGGVWSQINSDNPD
jgi:hypothetical protein